MITIKKPSMVELIEKKSRFIGQAIPMDDEATAQQCLEQIKKQHKGARHHVYAWVMGEHNQLMKSSDDGEPAGTGGKPVLETIKKMQLQNIMVVVTRYFGGILLGAGGLTRAYGKTAAMALEQAEKITKVSARKYALSLAYPQLAQVENYLHSHNIAVLNQVYEQTICLICAIEQERYRQIAADLTELTHGSLRLDDLAEDTYLELPFN